MKDLMTNKEKPDEEVKFYDGFLWIICLDNTITGEYAGVGTVYRICLCPEYDEPISLKDIANKYPKVRRVIFDDLLTSRIYSRGNHVDGEWEKIGETLGYA